MNYTIDNNGIKKNNNESNVLTENTYKKTMQQSEYKQDYRINKIINQNKYTNLWLCIIAFYCLINITEKIFKIVILLTMNYEINEIIKAVIN